MECGGQFLLPKLVHCWRFLVSDFAEERLIDVLSDDERERARRFLCGRKRAEYVICRGVLRHLLAAYGLGSASALRFSYTQLGKPMLFEGHGSSIAFSVAHSHGVGLIALAKGTSIGVDVEFVAPMEDFESLVFTCFAAEEQAEFVALPPHLQATGFFAGWTRKEAIIKATGEGLSRPLNSFAVTVGPEHPPRLIRFDDNPSLCDSWRIIDLTVEPKFAAAIAVSDVQANVFVDDLPPSLLGVHGGIEEASRLTLKATSPPRMRPPLIPIEFEYEGRPLLPLRWRR